VEREIYATRPLRDQIGLNVNAIFGVRYIDFRGLPSGIGIIKEGMKFRKRLGNEK